MVKNMIEEMAEALEALKEYCLHTACCDCMLYKPETGCFSGTVILKFRKTGIRMKFSRTMTIDKTAKICYYEIAKHRK